MKRNDRNTTAAMVPLVGCVVYVRKSTEGGLEQDYNSFHEK
jgi:hypothetical protein